MGKIVIEILAKEDKFNFNVCYPIFFGVLCSYNERGDVPQSFGEDRVQIDHPCAKQCTIDHGNILMYLLSKTCFTSDAIADERIDRLT